MVADVLEAVGIDHVVTPDFQQRVYGVVDCGSLLWHL
jgi:hypothetical protein